MTLQQLSQRPFSVPVATSWLLGDLGEAKGRQDFHGRRERLTDRDEQEVRGYREALDWIHGNASSIPISVDTIRRLHFLSHGQSGDAGEFKTRDGDIIEKYADGRSRVRFKTVPAKRSK